MRAGQQVSHDFIDVIWKLRHFKDTGENPAEKVFVVKNFRYRSDLLNLREIESRRRKSSVLNMKVIHVSGERSGLHSEHDRL